MSHNQDSFHAILARTKTITFDCYGTLIDWDAGLFRSFAAAFGPSVAERRRELFDAYVRIEADLEAGPFRSYRDLLALVLERLARELNLPLLQDRRCILADLLPTWTPFADTSDALLRLKKRFRLGILSNIDRDQFAGTARHFPVTFDFVVTAEDVRCYKPGLPHFERCLADHADKEAWLHVAQSQFHDGRPANRLDIAFAWINRYNDPADEGIRADAVFPDLRSLADAAAC